MSVLARNGSTGPCMMAIRKQNIPRMKGLPWSTRKLILILDSGWATSEILACFLARYVGRELKKLSEHEQRENIRVQKAIETAFVQLDKEIVNDALSALNDQDIDPAEAICRIAPASSGSCATLILLDPTSCVLHVACVGDSRAVLGRPAQDSPEWLAIPLSTDQTGFNQDEIDRINREHPGENPIDESSGRLLNCAVTRGFGDNRWKWPLEALDRWTENRFGRNSLANYLTPPYLTAQPVVTHTQMSPGDLVILASDGFWNHMESNEDAIHCASLWVKQNSGGEPEMQKREQGVEAGARGTWPYNWTVHREYFIADGEKNLATHMMKNAFGGSQHGLFRSVMSTKAPDAKEARDDATVVAIRF